MPDTTISDLHCHLNGSFSLEFLKETAERHQCTAIYDQLVAVRTDYLQRTSQQPKDGFPGELLGLVWKQFGLIHQIIRDLTDISSGVIDVVKSSEAFYLEIRTTPKSMAGQSRDKYIDAFEEGLILANKTIKKLALGLLSLDRTIHTLADAQSFIQRIKQSPNRVLTGLDICGDPTKKRTLAGNDLKTVINLALDAHIGIAIHMAESDSDIERQDTDVILSALEQWVFSKSNLSQNPLQGKVRLGHCIFLTEPQKKRIANLGVPIEVCPTCHSKLNWHLEDSPHPVTTVYPDISDPIVVGTDDEVIFGAGIKAEFQRVLSLFTNKLSLTEEEIQIRHAIFSFAELHAKRIALVQVDKSVESLRNKIATINPQQHPLAHKKSNELLTLLNTAREEYFISNQPTKQAADLFNQRCTKAIDQVKSTLAYDLDWVDILLNLLKSLYNTLVKPFNSDTHSLFSLKRSPSFQMVEEFEPQLALHS